MKHPAESCIPAPVAETIAKQPREILPGSSLRESLEFIVARHRATRLRPPGLPYTFQDFKLQKLQDQVDEWLRAPGSVRRGSSKLRRKDPALQEIKKRVRRLRKDGFSFAEICASLADSRRPGRAQWRDLDWPTAYRRFPQVVTKWLSDAGKGV